MGGIFTAKCVTSFFLWECDQTNSLYGSSPFDHHITTGQESPEIEPKSLLLT